MTHNIKNLEVVRYLKDLIYISSGMIIIFGVFFVAFGSGIEKLIGTCLTIPLVSIYMIRGKITRFQGYFIIDIHLLFWFILSTLIWILTDNLYSFPVLMFALFTVIFFKRKSNFILRDDCN